MITNLKSLQLEQKSLETLQEEFEINRKAFTEQNKSLIARMEVSSDIVHAIKEKVREEAIEEYGNTGEKKLLGGIGIRILSKLEYHELTAIEWARTNMSVAIKEVLDKKQFEIFAKTNDLDFVKKEEKVSVTFPKEITI